MTESVLARHSRNDLFTRAECEKILQEFLGAAKTGILISFQIIPVLDTIGYLGEYFYLHLTYHFKNEGDKHLETRLFVKSVPFQSANMTMFIEKSGIISKEAQLYTTLLNELKKYSPTIWCAQCYFTRHDLFVMQNINALGYEALRDSGNFLTTAQVKVILKGLAALHACSIAYEAQNNVNIGEQLQDVLYEATVSPKVDWYTAGVRAVLAVALQHPAYKSDAHQDFIKEKLPARLDCVYDMVNPSRKYRNVFCHRDPWGGNVFFHKESPDSVASVFVDYQLCRYSPAAIDVLMSTYLNFVPKQRKLVLTDCCDFYYENFTMELNKMGIDPQLHMSAVDFKESLEELQLFGALYNCISATILRVPGDYLSKMKQNSPEDFHRYTNVDRTKEVLELVQTHSEYREYLFDCIEDVVSLVSI